MPTTLQTGENGLEKVVIETGHGRAEVYRLGACLTRYARGGREFIFVSKTSPFSVGKPIRGGVPICWPWFGPHPSDAKLPQHGFARKLLWNVTAMEEGRAVLELAESAESMEVFPRHFRLRFVVTVGADGLTMSLETTNTDPVPFTFGDALHTYLAVSDIRKVQITGLKDHRYRDKVLGGAVKTEIAEKVAITGHTDRVYFDTFGPHDLITPEFQLRVHKSNSADTVVWNPDVSAEKLADLAGGQWPGFVCIETVNTAENSVTLWPGQSHTTTCRLEVR